MDRRRIFLVEWDVMSASERWAANKAFLDAAIARGDTIWKSKESLRLLRNRKAVMSAEVIAQVCNLPKEFYKRDRSMVDLLNETGIKRTPELLTKSAIGEYLNRHTELVDEWLLWSSNKRSRSGWYFVKEGQEYIVGYHPGGEKLRFTDALLACSEFVLREVQVLMRY